MTEYKAASPIRADLYSYRPVNKTGKQITLSFYLSSDLG